MNTQEDGFDLENFREKSSSHAGFEIPENYFENLEKRVMQRISEEKQQPPIGVLRRIPHYGWASLLVAASLAGIIFWNYFLPTRTTDSSVQLTQQELLDSDYFLGMDEFFIFENVDVADLDDLGIAQITITEEEVLAYSEYHEISEFLVIENF